MCNINQLKQDKIMKEIKLKVLSNKAIASNVYEMEFAVPENIILKSGQFINLSTGNRQHLLRRPFAIAAFTKDSFSICYQIKGSGTESLKHIQKGSQLSALLPLIPHISAVEYHEKKIFTKLQLLVEESVFFRSLLF